MKIILLITVCEQNKNRIVNQINNLNKHKSTLTNLNITPIFCIGNTNVSIDIPFDVIQLDTEESYVNLYNKILESLKYININLEYDYIIKIDDDTLFNIDKFDLKMLSADYIGRQMSNTEDNYICLPRLNIFKHINLGMNKKDCSYMTGDFYILSKKAVQHVLSNLNKVDSVKYMDSAIAEDYLIGYLLKDAPITTKDITLQTNEINLNFLQITENYMSIHPVLNWEFSSLINLPFDKQIERISNISGKLSLIYRKKLTEQLQANIIQVINNFFNSPKSSGIC